MTAPLDPKNDWVAKNPADPESEWRYTHTEQNLVADNVIWLKANGGGGGSGATNLTTTRTATTVTVLSDTGSDVTLVAADGVGAGVMTAADRSKFGGIAAGATANSTDAVLLNRANHTGTQPAATISGLGSLAAVTPTGTASATTFLNGLNQYAIPPGGGGGATNLTAVPAPTIVTVASDTGGDATLLAADNTNAGVMTSAMQVKLAGITAGADVTNATTVAAAGAVMTSTKNIANGVAGLNSSGQVAAAQLPSYVDDVVAAANLAAFPATGEADKIYLAIDTGFSYRWTGSGYFKLPSSPGSTDEVPEGAVNLYYTAARTDARIATGYTAPGFFEAVQDAVNLMLVQGTGITLAYNDTAGTLTINSSGTSVDITAIDGGVVVGSGGGALDGGTAASSGTGSTDGGTEASPGTGTIDGGTP